MKLSDLKFLKVAFKKHPVTDIDLEYLEKPDAIGVMILNSTMEKTLLVSQYRPGNNGEVLEIPAGIIEEGDTASYTLWKELREETGYQREDVDLIYKSGKPFFTSPGYTTEKLYLYVVRLIDDSIKPLELDLDPGEHLTCHWYDLKEVFSKTSDLKTVFALATVKNIKEGLTK